MRITILAYGSQGDVEPFAVLSRGLYRAGHDVRLAGPETFSHLVEGDAVDYIGLPGDTRQMVERLVNQARNSRLRMLSSMAEFILPLAEAVFHLVDEACQGAEVIIHSFLLTQTGYETARKLDIPDISAQFFPVFSTTSHFPAPTFPDLPLGKTYRRLTHQAVTWSFRLGGRFIYRIARRNNPDWPVLSGWPFARDNPWQTPILYALSPTVLPRPDDWPDTALITGYWIAPDPGEWVPETGLVDFIEDGPPPVAVAFGSTPAADIAGILDKVTRALELSGQRGVLVGASQGVESISPGILHTGYVPYGWLFKRCSAVIHHGGAGTTAQGLSAGVPNIILPFTSDQPFWARRVFLSGAGPRPLHPRRMTAHQLSRVLQTVLADNGMQAKARRLGELIRAENGVSRAVQLIEQLASSYSPGIHREPPTPDNLPGR